MAYIICNQDGRIKSYSQNFKCGENEIQVTLPQGFSPSTMKDWIYSKQAGFTNDPVQSETQVTPTDVCASINKLEDTDQMLIDCILELSQYVYGEA